MNLQDALQQLRVASAAFNEEVGRGPDDQAKMFYETRNLQNKDDDAPRMDKTMGEHPVVYRVRENLNMADPDAVEARARLGMEMKQTPMGRAGQLGGAVAADLIQDKTRSIWWLLNAAQAVGNVANDYGLKRSNPDLYGATDLNTPYNLSDLKAAGLTRTTESGREVPAEGVYGANGRAKQKNYRSGLVAALGAPVGFAVNSGMGLMTPFGGYEGYEAVIPDAQDPSKSANPLLEVASKYILGRTGNLLDWDEFKKVRPDVSKGEYNAYKAFKYDKAIDINPFDDGNISLPGGVLRATTDGIHGPEVQFLGRSLPVSTAIMPTATAILGTMAGVRKGRRYRPGGELAGQVDPNAVKRGLIGGTAGALGGMAVGNLIEGERRKRNEVSNQAYYDTL